MHPESSDESTINAEHGMVVETMKCRAHRIPAILAS